jgi:hypothetical protein
LCQLFHFIEKIADVQDILGQETIVTCLQPALVPTQALRSIQILTKSHLLELDCIQKLHKDNLEKLKFQ